MCSDDYSKRIKKLWLLYVVSTLVGALLSLVGRVPERELDIHDGT